MLRQILDELRALKADQDKRDRRNDVLEEQMREIKASVLRLELAEVPRIAAALDGLAANEEALHRQERRLARLEKEVGRQAMEHVAFRIVN